MDTGDKIIEASCLFPSVSSSLYVFKKILTLIYPTYIHSVMIQICLMYKYTNIRLTWRMKWITFYCAVNCQLESFFMWTNIPTIYPSYYFLSLALLWNTQVHMHTWIQIYPILTYSSHHLKTDKDFKKVQSPPFSCNTV